MELVRNLFLHNSIYKDFDFEMYLKVGDKVKSGDIIGMAIKVSDYKQDISKKTVNEKKESKQVNVLVDYFKIY